MKNLKKIYKSFACIALGASMLIMPTSCSDRLDGEFYNPDERTQGHLPSFFTKALQQGHLFRLDYGPTYHHINGLAMLLGIANHSSYSYSSRGSTNAVPTWTTWSVSHMSQDADGSIFSRTNVEYSVNIKGMELLYNVMNEADKELYKPYMLCARVVRSYAFQRNTDLYDDIPYTEAGGAFQEKFYPKYDTQETIYKSILDDLKDVVNQLNGYQFLYPEDRAAFASADILNGGDLDKWIRFANSLRLRMAMRIVNVEPELSRSIIAELIQDGRLITESTHDVAFKELNTDVNEVKLNLFFRGVDEMAYRLIAPKFILEDVLHADAADKYDQDPRLYVLFQPNRYGKYVGNSHIHDDYEYLRRYFPTSEFDENRFRGIVDSIAFNYSLSNEGSGWSSLRLVSQYNRATFMNYEMRFPVILSSEVNLTLAEAAIRWPEFGDPVSYLGKSIENSTRYFYSLNINNKYNESTAPDLRWVVPEARMTSLDEAHLAAYISKAGNEFSALDRNGKIKYLIRQKAICNNILNPFETYSEARRVIYDLGEIPLEVQTNLYWQERFLYPDTESTNNRENFEAVASKNRINSPVWWSGRTSAAINPNASPGVSLVYN